MHLIVRRDGRVVAHRLRDQGRRHDVKSGGAMASAVARDSKGVWGLCPQWGPGARPLVRGSGGLCPPEPGSF